MSHNTDIAYFTKFFNLLQAKTLKNSTLRDTYDPLKTNLDELYLRYITSDRNNHLSYRDYASVIERIVETGHIRDLKQYLDDISKKKDHRHQHLYVRNPTIYDVDA